MLPKGNKIYSIVHMKCPRCQEGDFLISHPYDLKHTGDIHETCNVCGLKYAKEPGFYYGAMYVAYALGVALFVTLWTSFGLFFPGTDTWVQIATIIGVTIIGAPYIFALSKIIWANMFIHYDKNAISYDKK